MRFVKELVGIFLMVILQSQGTFSQAFDLLVLFSIFIILRFSWVEGVVWAFIGGLLWDSLSGTVLGFKSLTLIFTCGVVGLFHAVFYQEHALTRFAMVFMGALTGLWFEWGIYALLGAVKAISISRVILTSVGTAFLAMITYPAFNLMFRRER